MTPPPAILRSGVNCYTRCSAMIKALFEKAFGTPSERTLKRFAPMLEKCNAFEAEIKGLADADFPARTEALRARVADLFAAIAIPANDEDQREPRKQAEIEALNEVLPEAFALC